VTFTQQCFQCIPLVFARSEGLFSFKKYTPSAKRPTTATIVCKFLFYRNDEVDQTDGIRMPIFPEQHGIGRHNHLALVVMFLSFSSPIALYMMKHMIMHGTLLMSMLNASFGSLPVTNNRRGNFTLSMNLGTYTESRSAAITSCSTTLPVPICTPGPISTLFSYQHSLSDMRIAADGCQSCCVTPEPASTLRSSCSRQSRSVQR